MIFRDVVSAIKTRLVSDPFFSGGVATAVQVQTNRNIRSLINSAINGDGVVVAASFYDYERVNDPNGDLFEVICDLAFYENPAKSPTKSAEDLLTHAHGSLDGYFLPTFETRVRVMSGGIVREEGGINIYNQRLQIRIPIPSVAN